MTAPFRFSCPACGAAGSSARDPGGARKTCERCGASYEVKGDPAAGPAAPGISLVPPADETRKAVEEWQRGAWFVPEHFAREATLSGYEPALRVTAETVLESRVWKETNGQAPPDPWSIAAPAPEGDGVREHRLPGSDRSSPCAGCDATGLCVCASCLGLGRSRCGTCAGAGCVTCGRHGVINCIPCAGRGKIHCAPCGGRGELRRAHILEIRRRVARRQRSSIPAHPLGPLEPPRPILELKTADRAGTLRRLETLPAGVRALVQSTLEDSNGDGETRVKSERVVVEQFPVWKAAWTFGKRSGILWFHGRPLRARPAFPPRNPLLFAITAWVALLIAGILGTLGYFVFRKEGEAAPAPAQVPAPVAIAAAPATPPAPVSVPRVPERLSGDGLVLRSDGSLLRGEVKKDGVNLLVQGAEGSLEVPPWQLESFEPSAADYIRGSLDLLSTFEGEVRGAFLATTPPPRAALVTMLLDLHRRRDRWVRLQALCRPEELPAGPGPVDRLDGLRERLEAALESKPALPAAAANAPASPAPAGIPPYPPELGVALERFDPCLDPTERAGLAAALRPHLAFELPARDLVCWAWLVLSRSTREWGLESDRIEARSADATVPYEGTLEMASPTGIVLRTPAGERIIATRGATGAWTLRAPGGVSLTASECATRRAMPSKARLLLLDPALRIGPSAWLSASGDEHLAQGKTLAGLAEKAGKPDERGLAMIRRLAAAHASAALRSGSGAAITEGRVLLQRLGYVPTPRGTWQTPDEATVLTIGRLLKGGLTGDALTMVLRPQGTHGFAWWYAAASARLLYPVASREELSSLAQLLDRVAGMAASETEGRHLQALRDSVSRFRVCGKCGGDSTSGCSACKGRGTVRMTCGKCGGHGVVIVAGQGGGTFPCPSCKGASELQPRACAACGGRGRVDCASCRGPFRLPGPADLCRVAPCPACAGAASYGDLVPFPCPTCAGLGLQLIPASNPDAVLR